MTKPNELTPAIERVEALAECDGPWDPGVLTIHDRSALRLVIEAAKRPTALSGEERKVIEEIRTQCASVLPTPFELRATTALTAALSLASPFTREELERLMWEARSASKEATMLSTMAYWRDLAAKLDAMLAQSSPANS